MILSSVYKEVPILTGLLYLVWLQRYDGSSIFREGLKGKSIVYSFYISQMLFGEYTRLYLSPPPPSEHLVCSGSTQRGHVLSSQCRPKTSPETNWHRQDTAALSTRTRLCLSRWSFSHGRLLAHLLCLFLPLSSSHPPHHPVLPCLSIRVTSLLLFVLSVLSFLPHSLAPLCSQRLAVADTVLAVSRLIVCRSDKCEFVMIGVCMGFWAPWQVTVTGCHCCLGSCCVAERWRRHAAMFLFFHF